MVAPFPDRPSRLVASRDSTRIAVFSAGVADGAAVSGGTPGSTGGPPRSAGGAPGSAGGKPGRAHVLLVHGTTADHRTWRVVAPLLAAGRELHAIDRRGRGDSGDGPPGAYSVARELEDVAAVCEELAVETGSPVDVVGHSLGGRIALGASLRTEAIGRVVAYESAPTGPVRPPGSRDALLEALRDDLAAGDHDRLLSRFMTEAVGMPDADLATFRADPVWPLRAAAAPTIVRELEAAETAPETALQALARVAVPVLQVVGSLSPAAFRDGAEALHARLVDGRLVVIEGARHAAHHSHPVEFIAAVATFLAHPRTPEVGRRRPVHGRLR